MLVDTKNLYIRNIIITVFNKPDVYSRHMSTLGLTSSPALKITGFDSQVEQHRRSVSSPPVHSIQGNYIFKGFTWTFRGRSIQGPGRTWLFAEPFAWLTIVSFYEPFLLRASLLFLLIDIDSYFGAESFDLLVHLCLPNLFTSEESLFFRVQWH